MLYRKRPLEVNAWRVRELCVAARDNWPSLPKEIQEAYDRGNVLFISPDATMCIEVLTLEGRMRADIDDMLIMGIKGELYPCKPDIFFESYEEVGTHE